MTDAERRTVLRRFICDNFIVDDGDFGDDESLLGKGIMDSTAVLELAGFLETQFAITVADEELLPANLDSVENLCAFLARKINGLNAAAQG